MEKKSDLGLFLNKDKEDKEYSSSETSIEIGLVVIHGTKI
jgi:hypothetical protein